MYKTIVLRTEPQEDAYQQLLEFACMYCKMFSLDWVEGGPINIHKKPLANELQPFLIDETSSQHGQLIEYHCIYQFTSESSKLLGQAKSLYLHNDDGELGWPKNLAFYVSENNPWLVSLTHNHEAFIYCQAIPFEEIRDNISFLNLELEKPVLEINGLNFSTLDEFYKEIADKLTLEHQ
jgi:hypothetical protein